MSENVERYDDEIDLRLYLEVLWRRKWLLILLVVLSVAAAYLLTRSMEPVYESEATVLIRTDTPGLAVVDGSRAGPSLSAETALQMLRSRQLAGAAAAELLEAGSLDAALVEQVGSIETWILDRVSAQRVGNTPMLRVRAEATSPAAAAAMANAMVGALERAMVDATQSDLRAAGEFTLSQLERVRQDLAALEAQAASARALAASELERERRVLEDLYASLLRQQEEVRMRLAVQSSPLQVIDRASPPTSPVRPRLLLNLAVAVVLGGFMGLAMVFVVEFFDVRVRNPRQIEEILRVPLLAQIPRGAARERGLARPLGEGAARARERAVQISDLATTRRDGRDRLRRGDEFGLRAGPAMMAGEGPGHESN